MEEKIDKLTDALVTVQGLIQKNGKRSTVSNTVCRSILKNNDAHDRESDTTIYCNTVPQVSHRGAVIPTVLPDKCFSSSSEEDGLIDTSDEIGEADVVEPINNVINRFVAEAAVVTHGEDGRSQLKDPQPSTSSGRQGFSVTTAQLAMPLPTLTRSEVMIHYAEASRARVLGTPGKDELCNNLPYSFLHSVLLMRNI